MSGRSSSASRIAFIHVPKAAGTSIIAMMRQNLGATGLYHAEGHQTLAVTQLLRTHKIVAGHFFLRNFSEEAFRDTYVFTILRDPVERVVSQYYYWRETEGGLDDRDVILTKSCELGEILRRSKHENSARWINAQTSRFSGEGVHQIANQQSLKRAKHNLRLLDFVGLHERLQESCSRLARDLGWRDSEVLVYNRTAHRPEVNELEPELRKLIEQTNSLDLELYTEACSIFDSGHTPPANKHELFHIEGMPRESGTREVFFEEIKLANDDVTSDVVHQGETLAFRLSVGATIDCTDLTIGLAIRDSSGLEIYGTNTWLQGQHFEIRKGESLSLAMTMKARLAEGSYSVVAALHPGRDSSNICYQWLEEALKFRVVASRRPTFGGPVDLEAVFTPA